MPDSKRNMSKEETVIFFHIPKAAGMTLSRIIERQYWPTSIFTISGVHSEISVDAFKQLPEGLRRKIKAIKGHMGFGLHEYLPQPSTYITMLRDPVDRIVSHYHYALQRGTHHYLYHSITSKHMTLADYASSGISPELNNGQTRLLSGVESLNKLTNFEPCTSEMLARAKSNLKQYFSVVGLSGRFDESLIILKKVLGWNNIYYHRRNETKNRPRKEDVSEETRNIIRKQNELDIELFEYGRILFEEQVAEYGASFGKDLESFRSSNEFWGRFYRYSISSTTHRMLRGARVIRARVRE